MSPAGHAAQTPNCPGRADSSYRQSDPASRTAAGSPRSSPRSGRALLRGDLAPGPCVCTASDASSADGNRTVPEGGAAGGPAGGASLFLTNSMASPGEGAGPGGNHAPRSHSDVYDVTRGHTITNLQLAALLAQTGHEPPVPGWAGPMASRASHSPRAGRSHPGLQREKQGFLKKNNSHARDSMCAHLNMDNPTSAGKVPAREGVCVRVRSCRENRGTSRKRPVASIDGERDAREPRAEMGRLPGSPSVGRGAGACSPSAPGQGARSALRHSWTGLV